MLDNCLSYTFLTTHHVLFQSAAFYVLHHYIHVIYFFHHLETINYVFMLTRLHDFDFMAQCDQLLLSQLLFIDDFNSYRIVVYSSECSPHTSSIPTCQFVLELVFLLELIFERSHCSYTLEPRLEFLPLNMEKFTQFVWRYQLEAIHAVNSILTLLLILDPSHIRVHSQIDERFMHFVRLATIHVKTSATQLVPVMLKSILIHYSVQEAFLLDVKHAWGLLILYRLHNSLFWLVGLTQGYIGVESKGCWACGFRCYISIRLNIWHFLISGLNCRKQLYRDSTRQK